MTDNPADSDQTSFPDPVYKETVLEPLFEGAKRHFVGPIRVINRAHLVMLAETAILRDDQAEALAGALHDIDEAIDVEALRYTGEVEDFFFLIEAELKKRLGPDLAGRLHTARSRNDIDHTVFKISLKHRLDELMAKAHRLAAAMIDTAARERDTLIVAYTHGQPAQPTTFGHYLGAAVEVLLRDLARLAATRETLDLCPMGAAAITTSGFEIDRHRMAHLLGFSAPLRNSYGCIASVDYVTGFYSALKLVFLHLGRLIQDLQVWTSFEVGQLYVPNSFVQISSIMPQKRNPVPIEHLRLLSSLTVGRCDTIVGVMHNTPFTDMNDSEGEVQGAGYAAFGSGARVLDLMAALIPAVKVDRKKVGRNIDASCITITELADSLVRASGLSFREAHEIAASTAKAVIERGVPLGQGYDAFAEAFGKATGQAPAMDEQAYANAVSPEHFIAVRQRFGGPGADAMDEALAAYRTQLDGLAQGAEQSADREARAATDLETAFADLLNAA